MKIASRQAAVGAFVAAALMLGASAAPDGGRPAAAPMQGALGARLALIPERIAAIALRSCAGRFALREPSLVREYQNCRDNVLGHVLDAAGDLIARLEQL